MNPAVSPVGKLRERRKSYFIFAFDTQSLEVRRSYGPYYSEEDAMQKSIKVQEGLGKQYPDRIVKMFVTESDTPHREPAVVRDVIIAGIHILDSEESAV